MNEKSFCINCDHCGKKWELKDENSCNQFATIPLAKIPGGIPYLDENKKIVIKKSKEKAFMYKCPLCGRGMVVKVNRIVKNEQKNNTSGRETSTS